MARAIFEPDLPVLGRHLNFVQDTILDALRQIRLALGAGQIFYGLEVYPAADGAVHVQPGLAFDGNGNPLVIHQPLRVPLPAVLDQPRILALRYQAVVEEKMDEGEAVLENDGIELVWLLGLPPDATLVPLAAARLDGKGRILIEDRIAPRAAQAGHRHGAELSVDRSGRLRYDGDLVAAEGNAPVVSPADLGVAMASLRRELLERIEALEQVAGSPVEEAAAPSGYAGWEPELELIDGLGKGSSRQLAEVGIRTLPQLLTRAGTPEGRQRLSRDTGIPPRRLEAWVRFADLMRLHGVAPEHARLLLDAGFEGVADLAAVEAEVAHDRIEAAFNPERHLIRKVPRLSLVRAWVHEARRLPPIGAE